MTELVEQEAPAEEAVASEEVPGLAEACRRFPLPDKAAAAHAVRELEWGEHLIVTRLVPSKGGTDLYLYSLRSAAIFLLDRDQANIGKGGDETIKLIDIEGFVSWIRDVVGDALLADAIEAESPADDPYNDRLAAIQLLLSLRMVQYDYALA